MPDPRINLLCKYDSEEIQRQPYKQKKKMRVEIVKNFLEESRKQNFENIKNPHDKVMLKNSLNFRRYSITSNLIMGAAAYYLLFNGVYNFGSIYWNPRKTHWLPKVTVVLAFSYFNFNRIWEYYLLTPDMYRLANTIKKN